MDGSVMRTQKSAPIGELCLKGKGFLLKKNVFDEPGSLHEQESGGKGQERQRGRGKGPYLGFFDQRGAD